MAYCFTNVLPVPTPDGSPPTQLFAAAILGKTAYIDIATSKVTPGPRLGAWLSLVGLFFGPDGTTANLVVESQANSEMCVVCHSLPTYEVVWSTPIHTTLGEMMDEDAEVDGVDLFTPSTFIIRMYGGDLVRFYIFSLETGEFIREWKCPENTKEFLGNLWNEYFFVCCGDETVCLNEAGRVIDPPSVVECDWTCIDEIVDSSTGIYRKGYNLFALDRAEPMWEMPEVDETMMCVIDLPRAYLVNRETGKAETIDLSHLVDGSGDTKPAENVY